MNNLEKKEEETLAMEVEVTIFYRESDGLSDDRSKLAVKFVNTIRNIARIANAVQVTLCLLVSTGVY